mgnify:FL=1
MGKKRKDGLESFVLKANKLIKCNCDGVYYLPMCNYFSHIGVVINEKTCLNRKCPHYDTYPLAHQDVKHKVNKKKAIKQEEPVFDSDFDAEKGICNVIAMESCD